VIHKSLNGVEFGQLLLADCGTHQQKLQGLEVPAFFTPGSFHALAEEKTVGWHPEYETLLGTEGKDDDSK
jgi:ABC-3C protein